MQSEFEGTVARQVGRLARMPLRRIEQETIAKRRAWLEQRYPDRRLAPFPDRPSPRAAFALMFQDYMGLDPADLPVVYEDDQEIVWTSRNPCPTLEACERLNLDTRTVCREVYERSTQAFFSWLDPRLRFLRDYRAIRPHADHCLERLVRVDFEEMMRLAIAQAKTSKRTGDKGYGAVVALGRHVLAEARDTAGSQGDPSLHAELNAIRRALQNLGESDLSGAVLYSTCEPCPMCASLAVWAKLSAVVFGASIEATAARGRTRIMVSATEIAAKSPIPIEVIGGVLAEECLALY